MSDIMKSLLATILLIAISLGGQANESRSFTEIRADEALPDNAVRLDTMQPIPQDVIENAVRHIAEQWNTANLEEVLADEFYDAQRLEDTLLAAAPRDAKMRVISIRGQQVLQQYLLDGNRYSRVSVTVRTQVEFNDPQTGFQRREGTAEWILKITEEQAGGGQ